MRLISIFFVLILLSSQSFAQDAKKGLKNYYKAKLADSEEEFLGILKTYKNSCLGNYGMALLHSDSTYAGYDLFAAFDELLISDKKRKLLRPDELKDVEDYFTIDSLDMLIDKVNWRMYEQVQKTNTWEFTQKYQALGESAKYQKQVLAIGLKQQYDAVKDTNTVLAFTRYLKKFPDSDWIEEATKLRNALAYKGAETTNTLDAYQTFVLEYPDATEAPQALIKRNELAYKATLDKNTKEAYQAFISDYPDAEQLPIAKKALVAIEFALAKAANNEKAWEDFIAANPGTPEVEQAVDEREKIAYEAAKQIQTTQAYDYFLKKYPKSKYGGLIFNLKADFLAANFRFTTRLGTAPEKFKIYDNYNTNNKASNLVKLSDGWLMLAQTMLSKKWQADAWVVKMNVNNELVWQRQLGKGNDDAIQYAVELPDKSLIIAGYTAAQTANGGKIWVLKLSESGEILWERTLDGVASNGICIKGDAIYLLTSFIDETRIYLPNLVKLDMNGELISNKTYPMLSNARGLVQTKDGQLVILCDKHLIKVADDCLVIASTPFDKIATAYNISNTPDGGFIVLGKKYDFQKEERSDFWVVKYDAAAVLSWQNTYDRDHSQEIALDAAVAPDGTISVVGLSEMENQNHIWLLKLNPTGQLSESLYIGTEKSEKNPKIAYGTDEKLRMIFSAGLEPDVIMALF